MLDKVYEQSLNLLVKAAYYYYNVGLPQSDISEKLGVSVPTVSRLLKKTKDKHIVEFCIPSQYIECFHVEQELKARLGIKEVIVSPINAKADGILEKEVKQNVALEGARYLQRMITKEDVLGIGWGRTMYYLIHYLNPSQKIEASFLTLHGSISEAVCNLDTQSLVSRASMAFGGRRYSLMSKASVRSAEHLQKIWKSESGRKIKEYFEAITISVCGVGCWYPKLDSPLAKEEYLTKEVIEELKNKRVCADLALHFIDLDGNECNTTLKQTTLTIDLETYRKISTKIVVASGGLKKDAILALLKGKLVDVLVIDYELAERLYEHLEVNRL
ncbi:sugar-binding transcriptional regulator [Lactonifactor longoviformis]|uniref:DNA-binding transcriptional regulator LsrR, DeoR family n=3 Tax=Lactonifactor TaxID=420345 RepID=A0A1M4UR37_9CLOT|nr:sugar-binding domain-containing protein [Lactonifactor longoviformis]SHE59211.1 DNA-binding transcriptional regulator LsrR, DeoR family [Lactonifactor longoviformis DSM 17459]